MKTQAGSGISDMQSQILSVLRFCGILICTVAFVLLGEI